MNGKKAYVSPQVIRVKLEPTQAVLSQCSDMITKLKDSLFSTGHCTASHGGCKAFSSGDANATS